jgi:hypothetical protein
VSAPPSAKTPPLGTLGFSFIAGMLVYSVARAFVVRETLGDYGIHPGLFLALDAGSSLPLAWGQIRLVQGLRQGNPALVQRAATVVAMAFLTPYVYLMFGAGKPLPALAYWAIGALTLAVGAATVWKIRVEARASAVLKIVEEASDAADSQR